MNFGSKTKINLNGFSKTANFFAGFSLLRTVAILISIIFGVSSLATVAVLSGYFVKFNDLTTLAWLLNLDLVLALSLIAILARRIVTAWVRRRNTSSGRSLLHIRLVASFGLVAVIPALLVAVFTGLFLNFGIESWFSDRVKTALNESKLVAEAYLKEHHRTIAVSAMGLAMNINSSAHKFLSNPSVLKDIMARQAITRELTEAVVVDGRGNTLARTGFGYSLGFKFSSDDFLKGVLSSRPGDVVIFSDASEDRIIAGITLEAFNNAYLLVGKDVKPEVLEHLSRTKGATAKYTALELNRETLKIKFLVIYGFLVLILLFSAIYIGWTLASQISSPIEELITVADQVSKGNFSAQVGEEKSQKLDELSTLTKTFNRMTKQIKINRNGLVEANRELDERRKFTEAVLSGVSAGVIGLSNKGEINVFNKSASELLELNLSKNMGNTLEHILPEMSELIVQFRNQTKDYIKAEIKYNRPSTGHKILVVFVSAERLENEIVGYVITFDDITELLAAQRKAAWSDVARRIAHEIKNPLTPIQLSAERIKQKYSQENIPDKTSLLDSLEMIIRQVQSIGTLVDEFSSFARMPQPSIKLVDIVTILKLSVKTEEARYPEIEYELNLPEREVLFKCDSIQIGQLLTNLFKNAAEAIMNSMAGLPEQSKRSGKISLNLLEDDQNLLVIITDNGAGFPDEILENATEPYVTSRDNGSGLGLAIAKKIMDDHQGELIIKNNPDDGATVSLIFKK